MKIRKNTFWALVIVLTYITKSNSQEGLPSDNQAQLTADSNPVYCGHVLDGPSYYIKQLENKSLDGMFTLTQEHKQQIGKANYKQILKKNKLLKDFQNKKRVLQAFATVKRVANSTIKFKLHVLASEDINAFTMIGGHIYITTGLLSFVGSIDELAFILSHEIGHHDKLHLERKIKKIMVTSTFFSATGVEDFTEIAIDMNNKFSAPFDQINEYEADQYAFELAKKAGYNTSRFPDFFKKLEKSEKRSILQKLNSTHPFSSDRRKCLENYIAN